MNIFQQIKDKLDFVQLLDENAISYMDKGGQLIVNCPFHDDNHPSLTISVEKKVFYCFACQESGDIIDFFAKVNNLSLGQAVRLLKDKYNLSDNPKSNKVYKNQFINQKQLELLGYKKLRVKMALAALRGLELRQEDYDEEYISLCLLQKRDPMVFWNVIKPRVRYFKNMFQIFSNALFNEYISETDPETRIKTKQFYIIFSEWLEEIYNIECIAINNAFNDVEKLKKAIPA